MNTNIWRFSLFLFLMAAWMPGACADEPVTTTASIPTPPSVEELSNEGYILPDLPRLTSQQLRQMIDTGKPLVVVDTRISFLYKAGHIPQAINIPYEPNNSKPAAFLALPKDKTIVFYTDAENDFDSAASASRLLKMEEGFDPAKILVLWKGYFWWVRLRYPVVT